MKYVVTKLKKDRILTPKNGKWDSLLIWMHGLGDSADGYVDFFTGQLSPTPSQMRVVLLTAPEEPVTINGGMVMNSWYDIYNLNDSNAVKEEDVLKNSERVLEVLAKEASHENINNDYKKIFVGGFSQGGCMSLYIGHKLEKSIGGIISCSGYLFPFIQSLKEDVPTFAYHGKDDSIIPSVKASYSYERLKQSKNFSLFLEDGLDHTFSYKEMEELSKFFKNTLKI